MKAKNVTIFIIVVLVVVGYFWLSSNEGKKPVTKTEEKSQTEQKKDAIIMSLAQKYSVNKDIPKDLVYSYQLEDALIKPNKPVIFTAELSDIFRKDGKLFGRFSPSIFDYAEPSIIYTLSGCEDKLLAVNPKTRDLWGEYIVVAKISDIVKPLTKIRASAVSEEEAELELSGPENFMATGTCLDFEYVEDGNTDKLFGNG